jgi:predicted component of type VI protein secretion system
MKLSLVVLSEGKASGQAIPITLSQFVIGRDPQCQLRPASAVISKRHCALITKGGKCFLRDFDSTNGTFINDEPVKGERELKHDDQLKVGPLTFRVVIEGAVPVNKQTPPPQPTPAAAPATGEDDDVAKMLLELADDGPSAAQHKGPDGVPDGTTVMDMVSPFAASGADGQTPPADGKPADGKAKPPDKKKESGNSSEAAQAILQKYMRRQRT